MIKNYLKAAYRGIVKNKVFSLINISGLAVGLTVFTLIMLWVKNEMSYDEFHEGKDRIALIMVNQTYSNKEIATFPATPPLLAGALRKDLPGVEYASRSSWGDTRLFTYGDKNFSEYGLYVDPDFLKVFSFPLLKGNADKVLREPNTVLISERLAKKYFGNENPVGKTIAVEKNNPYMVEGVLQDIPGNATLTFDFLMPAKDYINWAMGGRESWESNNMKTYVKLKPGVDRSKLNASLKDFMRQYTDQQNNSAMFLWKLKDWYLRFDYKDGKYAGGGRIAYVRLFIIIAIFILLLACINFMNLSTARATQRAKEVGVRKVIGAGRRTLVMQFIGESVLLSILAGIIAWALVTVVLPVFNNFLHKHIQIDFADPANLLIYTGIILVTGLLAGSYPAFVLSAFKPVKVLKSAANNPSGSAVWIRKGLVVTQFAVSVILIIGTMVISNQVNYIKNKDLGYHRENLIWFPNSVPAEKNETAINELLKVPGVMNVARASMTFTMPNNRGADVKWPGMEAGKQIFFSFITGDQDIIPTMGIEMKEGRSFSKDYGTDTAAYILNEEAIKQMGLKNPVGQTIETRGGKGTIVGVAKNFHFESLHNPIGPAIIECKPPWTWLFYVRMDGKNIPQTIKGIEKVYKAMAPGYIFDYNFQDKEYERSFRSEQQIGTLVNWFAFFAIFISCLGLLGLTLFTVERRTKEIGIRKVLGASVLRIVSLISEQFLVLITLAVVIAVIPAWYFMSNWLQDYTYHIKMGWEIFAIAGGIVLLVGLITIGIQAISAAMANPVKSLRTE